MDVEWGPDGGLGTGPRLDEFLLARIAEDERLAATAAETQGETWSGDGPVAGAVDLGAARHVARFDPARVHAECAAKRRIVLTCRAARPDTHLLGSRPRGLTDFPPSPHDQHQLAALTLALLALPYAGHRDYREEWRP